jgi:hypothetical protein
MISKSSNQEQYDQWHLGIKLISKSARAADWSIRASIISGSMISSLRPAISSSSRCISKSSGVISKSSSQQQFNLYEQQLQAAH